MLPEKNIQSCLSVESPEKTTTPNAHLMRLALLRWVQRQINNLLARWRLLLMTHGRGWRWRLSYRLLLQGAAALLLAVGMLLSPLAPAMPAYAGVIFAEQTGTGNPMNGVDVGWLSTPTFVDIDGDGDMDVFSGQTGGTIKYYQNSGTALAPAYSEQTGTSNPFDGVDVGTGSTPTFVDIDGDGDMDAFMGEYEGVINYYKNTGTALAPAFIEQTGTGNPFDGVDVGYDSYPTFVDINHDGDMDAFIGEWYGTLKYYKNSGTVLVPAFSVQIGTSNPFNGVDIGEGSPPAFVDIDGDGDMDAFIGESYGTLKHYKNTGTALTPAFSEQTGASNPFNSVDVGTVSTPAFVDIDGDGDMDAFIGEEYGTIKYYKNIGDNTFLHVFNQKTGAENPLNGVNVGSFSTPTSVDIDHDGDMDAFSGEWYGTLKYYKNSGTTLTPAFSEQTGTNNPFNGVDVGLASTPTFVDIDGDGDMDAFSGEGYGTLKYFKNTGTALVPTFSEQIGTNNPFDGVNVGSYSAPAFVDIDHDGDMDAFIGEGYGTIKCYKNTGTALAPAFSEQTGTSNPLDGVDVSESSTPTFVDIDGDGDMDAFIGVGYGTLNYYKNSGTAMAPAFTEQTGAGNPFDGVDVGWYSAPTFVDIDGDGDMDAFVGERYGAIYYYEATRLEVKNKIPLVLR